jgi:uncharacterized protein YecA (UPF0149 family)
MDTRTGQIFSDEKIDEVLQKESERKGFLKRIDSSGIVLSAAKRDELSKTGYTKIGRNDPCPCGSGRKFKRCCYFYKEK